MEEKGSFLLGALGKSFRDVLRGALSTEQVDQVQPPLDKDKKKKKVAALLTKAASKDEKGSKEKAEKEGKEAEVVEKKFVPRDGNTSLITYSNASNFAVFSHIRNFVLQNQLCEMFNTRFAKSSDDVPEEDETEEEAKKRKQHSLSKVVSMGVRGVFEIIRETWHSHPQLCVKALQSFLDLLQGQAPSGLKYEPKEITDALYELLSQMVSEESRAHDDDPVSSQLSSVACACLLSLVVGLGDTSKMLSAISMMLIASQLSTTIQVPQIFLSLQKSVQAVLLKGVREVNWSEHGVQASSMVDSWKIDGLILPNDGHSAIASDGQWLYIHCAAGLLKLGSGYGGTRKGFVYEVNKDFYPNDSGWLGYGNGKLYFFKHGLDSDTIHVIDPKTFKVENELQIPDDSLGSQSLFITGDKLGQVRATKEGGFLIREFTTLASPLVSVEEKPLNLAQRNLLCMGKAKYDQQEHLHTLYATSANTIERVVASRTFAVVQTTQGKLYYTGNGEVFGVTDSKETKPGEWVEVPPIPDNDSKITYCTCDTNGTYFIVVYENEAVYFRGTNKKGESGEATANNPKPIPYKKMEKVKDSGIISASCGNHTVALLNKEGQLHMFGDLPISGITDEATGVVTALLGIPVSQVVLGHSHTCVLTQLGTVYTFGGNNFGQCGRDYQPQEEEKKQDVPAEESSSSEEEEEDVVVRAHAEIMCRGGGHSWSRGECRVCSVCGYCTGYGPNCVNTDKYLDPGTVCGCGAGDAGCEDCGCCKVCGGELDPHEMINHDNSIDDDIEYIYEDGREDVKARMEANEIELKKKVKRKKKKPKKEEDKKKDKEALAQDPNYLPVPSEVHFPGDMTSMQIECGTFHTVVLLHSGEVFTFGNNNHGQLGQSHTKPCGEPSKVDLPGPVSQIACGDNHTVVLLASGEIYTFGKHKEGQLGRSKDADDEGWYTKPGAMASVGDASGLRKASWISARGNQTFVSVHESLLSETSVSQCSIFANTDVIGILPPEKDMYLVVLDQNSTTAKRFDGSEQAELHGKAFCIDPVYNVLWTHSVSDQRVCCYNPIAAGIQGTNPAGTILSPSLVLPSGTSCGPISRQLAALNLLSCINTLASCSEMSLDMVLLPSGAKPNPDDFSTVMRFEKFSGSWGYGSPSNPTYECIRFNASQEVLLGGIGLFAGRGEYKADIIVYDLGKSGDDTNEPAAKTIVLQHKEDTYKTASKEIKKVFFSKPTALKPHCWYLIKVCIHGPSSDAGGDGKRMVTGDDGVKFTFMNSKTSNNGTDTRSGQIPLIIYRLANAEDDKDTDGSSEDKKDVASVHMIKKDFAGTVTEVGIQAVLKLLEWSWRLFSNTDLVDGSGVDMSNATFIATTCVNLLKIYITYAYPLQGTYRPVFDNPVMAQSVYDVHCLMKYILSSRHSSVYSTAGEVDKDANQLVIPLKKIIDACHIMFRECFHVFYPSGVLKWYAACRFLERLDPHDIYTGIAGEKLLSAVLDALSDPSTSYIGLSYESTVSLSTVLQNTEPEKRYPVLAEFMHMKALEEEGDRELLSFEIIASKLLSVVVVPLNASLRTGHGDKLPVSSIVESSGRFLVSRMTELALAASHTEAAKLSSLSVEETSKSYILYQLPSRYSGCCNDLPQVDVTDLLFSVNKPIVLHNLNLFGQPEREYKFTVFVAKESNGSTITNSEGQAKASKDGILSAQFKQVVDITAGVVYRVHVMLNTINEPSYRMGEGGKEVVSTEEGVVFTFHHSEQQYCDYRTSVIASIIYSFGHDASNPVELSIALSALFLETFVNFLEQFLSAQSPEGLMEQAGNTFFLSTLLPISLAHLGPIVCYHPKYVIKVLTLMKRVIPLVCAANQKMSRSDGMSALHMNSMHYVLVETDHPYKAPGVNLFNVKFVDKVQWMSLEFDSRSGFAQQWDKMEEFVIPNVPVTNITSNSREKTKEPVTITIDKSEIHYKWGENHVEIPNGLVLLPGSEVNVRVVMDTEYEKHDDANHYGIRCQVVGYEWGASHSEILKVLEKELVNLSATLASFLLQENTKLPWIEELPVDASYGSSFSPADFIPPPRDPEKADMRIVESAAKDVLINHPQLLGRGIAADMPSVGQVLLKDLPVKQLSSQQIFLKDFISCSGDTPGARMAKWLQPDRSVDMQASELIVPSEGATCWENVMCTAQTRDHDGTRVYVPHMKVEIKLIWLRDDADAVPVDATFIECMMGVYKPCFDKPYASTKINNYQFNSIPTMMAYSDYSFEELRMFSPRGPKNPDYMLIDNQENGNYTAQWVPTVPGVYSVQLYVDGRHTGQSKELVVKEKPAPVENEDEAMIEEKVVVEVDKEKEQSKVEEKTQPELLLLTSAPKAKKFYGRDSSGLRVRSEPSLLSSMVGLLKPGDLVHYVEEVTNDVGRWIKLTEESLGKYCENPTSEGYALCYSVAAKKMLLEDEEVPAPMPASPQQVEATVTTPPPQKAKYKKPRNKKRMGGPGEYEVVQCGSAGHNIRSQPNMNGAPVGRLTLKDTFTAMEEVENKDGIWLRLSDGGTKKYCTGEKKSNVWTLACASSGRLFIRMIGDDYEFGVPIVATTASKASVSQQLFSSPKAATVFATSGAVSKSSSATVKLSFGQDKPTPVSTSTSSTTSEKEEKKDSKEAKDMKGKKLQKQASLARRRAGTKKAASMTKQDSEIEDMPVAKSTSAESVKIIQALSPAVAECQRAVYAAFLWHQGLVHDAMASSFHLKLHPSLSKEMIHQGTKGSEDSTVGERKESSEKKLDEGTVKKEDGPITEEKKEPIEKKSFAKDEYRKSNKEGPTLPPTLSHLVTFWEEISAKVLEISNQPLRPPKIPSIVRELQKEFEEHKKSEDKKKKEAKKPLEKAQQQGPALCELCDGSYSDPVTYHMKEAHPGCGKHAGGFGYNSRGSFCSGWAGNCGDGGKGGSTWYLMCKDCHEKYLAEKISVKKVSKPVLAAAAKTVQQPGKPRVLQSVPSIQSLIHNAQFLLEVNGMSDAIISCKHSEIMQHTIASTSSAISPTELKKAESVDAEVAMKYSEPSMSRPKFLRSVSMWPEGGQTPTEEELPDIDKTSSLKRTQQHMSAEDNEGVFDRPSLVERPSMALARLVYKRSRHEDKEDPYNPIVTFIINKYDLDGLRVTMRQAMCTAAIKSYALEMLQWLLHMVKDTGAVHDTLWQFVTTICPHPMDEKLARQKDKEKDKDKQKTAEGVETESLGRHPLLGLDGAGTALVKLRRQFHCFLQAVSELMPTLPMGSAVQQMAMKCWCLQFQPEDQSFLIQSNVFANISTVLSNVEEVSETVDKKSKPSQSPSERAMGVWLMQNVLAEGRLKPSSNDAMANSLTDGSTETFWESRDEPRSKTKALMVNFNDDKKLYAAAIHNDNGKDSGQRITELSLLIGPDEANLKKVNECNLSTTHAGWTILLVPANTSCQVIRVELKGSSNNVRVRQLQVLAKSNAHHESCIPTAVAQQRSCEVEALRIFRLLTSQVFGSLLSAKADKKEDETDNGEKIEKDQLSSETDLHEQLGSLFGKDQLNRMQKRVCEHVIKSIHSEADRMKEDWKNKLGKQVKPDEQDKSQESDEAQGQSSPDTYCFELVSMVMGLCQSGVGRSFLAEQAELITDLLILLHVSTTRIQLQVVALLEKVIPDIAPRKLADYLNIAMLPPEGYSAIAAAINSGTAVLNHVGLLDIFLACISKALSVQAKAKGRSAGLLQDIGGGPKGPGITLTSLLASEKTVSVEAEVKEKRWWLKGSIAVEVATEIITFLRNMTKGEYGSSWSEVAKAAIGQTVLHLTKLTEDSRIPIPGMYSQTLWLCLGALCVIDEQHAEVLSSGQWMGQDGKPRTKPLCDNHDDGVTQALILCDVCGNLCGDCDRILHLPKKMKSHQRQVFKEEEEAVKVDLHEGCGRIKLYWAMVLADCRTLKGLIEFRETTSGTGGGQCRFCGSTNNVGLLAIGSVCAETECQNRAKVVCTKTLPCGHPCNGVQGEEECLPCLYNCKTADEDEVKNKLNHLKQDADDMCMICYTENLSCAPCIQLECGHVFHYHCCNLALTKKWSGPRISFRFMFCSLCQNVPIAHPKLKSVLDPVIALYEDVKRKCLLRLEYENKINCDALTNTTSKFYQLPFEYAMSIYCYYVCCKCKKSYYGGEARCVEQAGLGDEFDPNELVCGGCSDVAQAQVCAKHGTDFLEYKCRYCCSVAVYFCFGTTHFCNSCHNDFQRLTSMKKSELPQCPVAPRAKPMEGNECPLHVKHPPTGEEFALGCGVCRNAQTF